MNVPQVPPGLRPYLDEIAERLYSGRAAVLVGAGFSKNALRAGQASHQFPDWRELGDTLYKRLHNREPSSNDRYVSVTQLADEVEAAIGRPALDQFLRLQIPDLAFNPSSLHEQLLSLPWIDVLTTNYDTLLERASRAIVAQQYDVVVTQQDLVYSKSPRIIKLHGSFPSNRPFVITSEDYRRYPVDYAPFVNTVRQRLIETTLCLVGFSGNDPNFVEWVGWTQDTLGADSCAKMYLLTMGLSPSETKLLEQRNIVPLDMSDCPDIDPGNHYQATERFLDYLTCRKVEYDSLNWPTRQANQHHLSAADTDDSRSDRDKIADIVANWQKQRESYPGWVVLPKDQRDALWTQTQAGYSLFPPKEELPLYLALRFSFELVWRLERCLTPLYTGELSFLETTIDRLVSDPEEGVSHRLVAPSQEDDRLQTLDVKQQQEMCHYLLLALLRTHREEGNAAQWERTSQRIQASLPSLSPEHRSRFHYELAVAALYELNLSDLRHELAGWHTNGAVPFWEAKKAGLLAYIGDYEEADRLLKDSLQAIRMQTNLKPVTTDYTLVSQEAYVMVMLNHVKQAIRYRSRGPTRDDELQHLNERWQVLRQYRCDPWLELRIFRQALSNPTQESSDRKERPTFDIGRVRRSITFGGSPQGIVAYRYLRFREEVGLPIRMSSDITTSAATSIVASDPYWATAVFVQAGEARKVGQVFDRASLVGFDKYYIDSLIDRYLNAVEIAKEPVSHRRHPAFDDFGNSLGRVVPEILSRLCTKASDESKYRVLDYLIDVHRLSGRSAPQGVRNLTRRLFTSLSVKQRVEVIPRLLQIPTPKELSPLEERELVNPFSYLEADRRWRDGIAALPTEMVQALVRDAASTTTVTRQWALATLGALHDLDLINEEQQADLAVALWGQRDEDGLPEGTGFDRFRFLSLPHPASVDPSVSFRQYVKTSRFFDPESTSVSINEIPELCHEIIGGSRFIEWSDQEVCDVVNRLCEWWEVDKDKLLRGDDGVGFSMASEYRRKFGYVIEAIGAVVAPPFMAEPSVDVIAQLNHLVSDMAAHGMPSLELRASLLHLFSDWRASTLCAIKEAISSSSRPTAIDALRALSVVSQRISTDSSSQERDDLVGLVRVVGELVYWRRYTALTSAINIIAGIVAEKPWNLVGDTEHLVLRGLGHLSSETSLASVGRFDRARSTDTSAELGRRKAAAGLAYMLYNHYRARGIEIPTVIAEWKRICHSDDEFAEIVNQWID